MFEMIIKPKKAERHPWEMFFVGLFYASLSFLLVTLFFAKGEILREGSGLLIVIFTVICCLPFMYYLIKLEEHKDFQINDSGQLIREHSKAIKALMYLFLGFVVAFSFWYLVMPEQAGSNFNFQLKTFCAINSPSNYDLCLQEHGVPIGTGAATSFDSVLGIFVNNVNVLIFTIVLSIALGAGAIFVLVWNATVISAAIGIFAQGKISNLPLGLLRYMIHGIPEIAAYFIGALAGGIISVAVIRRDLHGERIWKILQDALILMIIAILILVVAALVEVYLTHKIF